MNVDDFKNQTTARILTWEDENGFYAIYSLDPGERPCDIDASYYGPARTAEEAIQWAAEDAPSYMRDSEVTNDLQETNQ